MLLLLVQLHLYFDERLYSRLIPIRKSRNSAFIAACMSIKKRQVIFSETATSLSKSLALKDNNPKLFRNCDSAVDISICSFCRYRWYQFLQFAGNTYYNFFFLSFISHIFHQKIFAAFFGHKCHKTNMLCVKCFE